MTDKDAEQILLQIDVDGDASNLSFDEFVAIMDGMKVGAIVFASTRPNGARYAFTNSLTILVRMLALTRNSVVDGRE